MVNFGCAMNELNKYSKMKIVDFEDKLDQEVIYEAVANEFYTGLEPQQLNDIPFEQYDKEYVIIADYLSIFPEEFVIWQKTVCFIHPEDVGKFLIRQV